MRMPVSGSIINICLYHYRLTRQLRNVPFGGGRLFMGFRTTSVIIVESLLFSWQMTGYKYNPSLLVSRPSFVPNTRARVDSLSTLPPFPVCRYNTFYWVPTRTLEKHSEECARASTNGIFHVSGN